MKDQIIDILIPISSDRFLPQVVLDHLLIQDYPLRFFMSNVIGNSAIEAREAVKQMWQASNPVAPFCMMMDNDIILHPGTLDLMLVFLQNNPDFGGVSLQRGAAPEGEPTEAIEPDHVSAGPILYRSSDYQQISYMDQSEGCDCLRQARALRALGQRVGFLCGVTYSHIKNTRRQDKIEPEEPIEQPHEE